MKLDKYLNEASGKYPAGKFIPAKYPELDKLAKKIANDVALEINSKVKNIDADTPHKAQYTLEELIELLQAKV